MFLELGFKRNVRGGLFENVLKKGKEGITLRLPNFLLERK